MRVLVIGSGAREHALLLALRADPQVEAVAIGADLVVIGPEVPLVLGVADAVRDAGIACFGPSKAAAEIEGSKAFAKDVMATAGVRTASSEIVDPLMDVRLRARRWAACWRS